MISTNEIKNKSTHRESMNYNELKFHPFPLYMCTRCMFIFVSTGFIEQNVTSEYYFFNISIGMEYIFWIFPLFSSGDMCTKCPFLFVSTRCIVQNVLWIVLIKRTNLSVGVTAISTEMNASWKNWLAGKDLCSDCLLDFGVSTKGVQFGEKT